MEIIDVVSQLTGNRPYCFVIMPYKSEGLFYSHIKRLVTEQASMACIRADEVPGAGSDLLNKIHRLISRATVVIADISGNSPNDSSPNVYYEIGYAVAAGKSIIITAKKDTNIPTDLKGMEILTRDDTPVGMELFDRSFIQHIVARATVNLPLLRDMLLPSDPAPSYIVCSPKLPGDDSRFRSHPRERRTYGDYLGVLGIVNCFGALLGESNAVEIVSSRYASTDIAEQDVNLFLIGSPKSNELTADFLSAIQKDRHPRWSLEPAPGEKAEGDYTVVLEGEPPVWPPKDVRIPGDGRGSDYGLIIRGPHPKHPKRTVMILAGAHSLGTGAACLAATKSQLITQIQNKLPNGVHLSSKERSFWILVRGIESLRDGHLDAEDVEVIDAGVYA